MTAIARHRLLLVTDAWSPQTNGVVTTLQSVVPLLQNQQIDVQIINPAQFDTVPLPSYPEIRVARNLSLVRQAIVAAQPDAIHIATEGPLGLVARSVCKRQGWAFTTSLHTKFPEYLHARTRAPLSLGYRFMRWFHRPAHTTLVTTASHKQELTRWGLEHLSVWGRGVDTRSFAPQRQPRPPRTKPMLVYVGRVAVEKNIEAFLSLPLDAQKVVVGDGPARTELQARYPDAQWLGYRKGQALAMAYWNADVFVFPSRTDTFGLVMLEAMSCGTPVAAYPVTGPKDVVVNGENGWLDEDLKVAVQQALLVDRQQCRSFALNNSWSEIARRMAGHLVHVSGTPLICAAADEPVPVDRVA